jgi:hypothetical protein
MSAQQTSKERLASVIDVIDMRLKNTAPAHALIAPEDWRLLKPLLLAGLYAEPPASAQPPLLARHRDEWREDTGPVVWWKFPVDEPAWIGAPNDSDWPGYHTHWTPHPALPERIGYSTETKPDEQQTCMAARCTKPAAAGSTLCQEHYDALPAPMRGCSSEGEGQ